MSTGQPRYGRVDREYAQRLAATAPADDGPVWMVNLMKYREVADYDDGTAPSGEPISGRDADDRYAPTVILADIGAEIALFADVDQQLLGDDTVWDRVGIVKYPTRRSFIDMQRRRDFQDQHVHKEAGMAATIVAGCQPNAGPGIDMEMPDWRDVAHPPTASDGPVVVLHAIRYADGGLDSDMVEYTRHAAEVAVPHGCRIGAWFDVEGVIVGDGRPWDQMRFNLFPSKAAFMAVVFDPARLDAQQRHREPAIADTYTVILRPQRYALDFADLPGMPGESLPSPLDGGPT